MDRKTLEIVIHTFISNKMDYCNGLLLGAPATELKRLQKVQNAAAHILTNSAKREHITPVLFSLHWLPVEQRVKFKTLLNVHKAIHGTAPAYLEFFSKCDSSDIILRSCDNHTLNVPFTCSSLVLNRAFSVSGAKLWNSLPVTLRSINYTQEFKRQLKTFLFSDYF